MNEWNLNCLVWAWSGTSTGLWIILFTPWNDLLLVHCSSQGDLVDIPSISSASLSKRALPSSRNWHPDAQVGLIYGINGRFLPQLAGFPQTLLPIIYPRRQPSLQLFIPKQLPQPDLWIHWQFSIPHLIVFAEAVKNFLDEKKDISSF